MTEGPEGRSLDTDLLRRGAASMTERQVREVTEREAEIRARFEQPGPIGRVLSDVNLLLALIKDYWNGEYRQAPWWAVTAVTFCFLYVLSPVDLLPDWVPLLGQVDDLVVITACLMLIEQELQEYKRWKLDQVRGDQPVDADPRAPDESPETD